MEQKPKVLPQQTEAPDLELPEDEVEEDDVTDLVDPLGEARKAQRDGAQSIAAGLETGEDSPDAIVRAAKAMRSNCDGRQTRSKRCLVVDDSRVIRKITSSLAKDLGYVVAEAENGEEALTICRSIMPDLVVTDWDMPEMDGLEFVSALRAIPCRQAPKVVFCTSKRSQADIYVGIATGADDYIVKPFKEEALREKLEQLGLG